MITVALAVVTVCSLAFGLVAMRQLYRWERQLRGVRVQVTFKGRVTMTPRLLDWLKWGLTLEGDKQVNGQVIYKQGGTTIALLKPSDHGKSKTRKVAAEDPKSFKWQDRETA